MATMNFGKKDFNKLVGVSVAAQAIKIAHLIELFETQTLFTTSNYIRNLYEQAAAKQSKAVINITKSKEFNQASIKINELLAKDIEHPKVNMSPIVNFSTSGLNNIDNPIKTPNLITSYISEFLYHHYTIYVTALALNK